MKEPILCVICGRVSPARRKTCRPVCRSELAKRVCGRPKTTSLIDRTCVVCGVTFHSSRPNPKCCTVACSRELNRRRQERQDMAAIVKARADGKTMVEIAKWLGVSKQRVQQLLKRHNDDQAA